MKIKRILSICICIALLAFSMTGCFSIGSKIVNGLGNFNVKSTGEETLTVKMPDEDKLHIKNETGNVYLNRVDGDSIKIRMVKNIWGKTQQDADEVFDNIKPFADIKNGRFEIAAVMKDSGEDFWEWRSGGNMVNASIDFYVDIPKDFKDYSIDNTTGDLEAEGISGTVGIHNTTGNITLSNVTAESANLSNTTGDIKLLNTTLKNDNKITLTTGSINMDVNLDNASSLDVSNVTGDVRLNVPATSKLSMDAGVTTGSIGGDLVKSSTNPPRKGNFTGDINGRGTKVNIHLVTGDININSK